MQVAVAADHVFDGTKLRHDCAVVIEGSRIRALIPRNEVPSAIQLQRLPRGAWLAPGFIDSQVNGGGDLLFNDDPSPRAIAAIAAAHRQFGTTAVLPTLLSDEPDKMRLAREAVEVMAGIDPSVIGLHYEGPFLSADKRGVHDHAMLRRPGPGDADLLAPLRQGVMLVTLAPDQVPKDFISQLVGTGARVSLGHSMATYAQTQAALSEGLTGFTHLFNAMRPLTSREPGPIAAALEDPGAWFGMIVDGAHVAPAMLRLALRGACHPMLVTDAMPPVGGSCTSFRVCGQDVTVHDGRCRTADGILAGSVLDMASAVRNCVRLLDLPLAEALRLASASPAAFLGIDDWLGRLAPGYRADMVALDPDTVDIFATWVAGTPSATA
jgi:N-acetylglucosamine-6-phosphate deacetylase